MKTALLVLTLVLISGCDAGSGITTADQSQPPLTVTYGSPTPTFTPEPIVTTSATPAPSSSPTSVPSVAPSPSPSPSPALMIEVVSSGSVESATNHPEGYCASYLGTTYCWDNGDQFFQSALETYPVEYVTSCYSFFTPTETPTSVTSPVPCHDLMTSPTSMNSDEAPSDALCSAPNANCTVNPIVTTSYPCTATDSAVACTNPDGSTAFTITL